MPEYTLTENVSQDINGRRIVGPGNLLPTGRRVGSTNYAIPSVEGQDAHDAPSTSQPLQIGGVAESTVPSAVGDGDAVKAFFDLLGQLSVILRGSTGSALLPNGAALADATANPTLTQIATFLHLFNGTTWDRLRGDTANGLDVDVTRNVLPTGGTPTAGSTTLPLTTLTQLSSNQPCKSVLIQSRPTNNVSAILLGTASGQSIRMQAGDVIVLPVSNVNLIYALNALSGTQFLDWLSVN